MPCGASKPAFRIFARTARALRDACVCSVECERGVLSSNFEPRAHERLTGLTTPNSETLLRKHRRCCARRAMAMRAC